MVFGAILVVNLSTDRGQEVISTDSFNLWGCDTYPDDAASATSNRWVNHSKHHREESKGRYDGLCKMNLAGSLYLTFLSRVANRSDSSVLRDEILER